MTLQLNHVPLIVGENGHLLATDGELSRVVVLTPEALQLIGSQAMTVEGLSRHSGVFLAIAEQHLARMDTTHDRIWVQEEDVDFWLTSEPVRRASMRAARRLASGTRHLPPQVTARLFSR